MFNRIPWEVPQDATAVAEWEDGGYPLYYVIESHLAILCPECVNSNLSLCKDKTDPEWFVTSREVNWEDPSLYCDNCSNRIESAYADDDIENSLPETSDGDALASAGFGTDEDYGCHGGGDD